MKLAFCALLTSVCFTTGLALGEETWPPAIEPIERSVDLNVGESCDVKLSDGSSAAVKLVGVEEIRDDLRQAVREARVTLKVNGKQATLVAGNYRLPVALGGVQIDCSITKGCVQKKSNPWALSKDARLRLWPAGSPWIQPGTFQYPMHVRWFSSLTHMANEPVYVDGGEEPAKKEIYYHYGLDTGGAEGLADIFAAVDGVVAVAGLDTIMPKDKFPSEEIKPRYDVIYLRDGRGWYYRYSHLDSFDPAVKVGEHVKIGQRIGALGKRGASGGWSHLHFDIVAPQPSGKYGISDAYAFFWQAYQAQYHPQLQAVARPHHVAWAGDEVALDGSLTWSAKGPEHIAKYEWTLSDGRKAEGAKVTQRYPYSGEFSEILKVTDDEGRVSYDFCIVQVVDHEHPDLLPPAIHAVYWPTLDLKAGDDVTFRVRSFQYAKSKPKPEAKPEDKAKDKAEEATADKSADKSEDKVKGKTEEAADDKSADDPDDKSGSMAEIGERWNFGDGTPIVEVQSIPMVANKRGKNSPIYAKDGYATTTHRYAKPGDYLVSVSRINCRGQKATARLAVHIDP